MTLTLLDLKSKLPSDLSGSQSRHTYESIRLDERKMMAAKPALNSKERSGRSTGQPGCLKLSTGL